MAVIGEQWADHQQQYERAFDRCPERLGSEDIRSYQLHLIHQHPRSICANQSAWANLRLMGAVFTHAPIEPRAIAVSVATIHFDAACRYCRDGRRATTNIRTVDAIGRPGTVLISRIVANLTAEPR